MHRAALVVLLLAGCAAPAGVEVEECDGTWREVESQVIAPAAAESEPMAVDCIRRVGQRRVRIGFTMPAGPSCHRLTGVDVVETAEAVSITLLVGRADDPLGGACPDEAIRAATELDLQAPVGDRALLDGSRTPPPGSDGVPAGSQLLPSDSVVPGP